MNEMTRDNLLGQISATEILLCAVIRTLPAHLQAEVKAEFLKGAEAARVDLMNSVVPDQARDFHDRHLNRLAQMLASLI